MPDCTHAQLDDVALALRDYRERLSLNPGRVDEIESRLAVIERLKKKYGASVIGGIGCWPITSRRRVSS